MVFPQLLSLLVVVACTQNVSPHLHKYQHCFLKKQCEKWIKLNLNKAPKKNSEFQCKLKELIQLKYTRRLKCPASTIPGKTEDGYIQGKVKKNEAKVLLKLNLSQLV